MKISTIFTIFLAGIAIGAAEVVPQVNEKGILTLSCDGRTIVESSTIQLHGCPNGAISKSPMKTFRNRSCIRNVWSTENFEFQRLVTTMPNGSVKIEWNGKCLKKSPGTIAVSVVWLTPIPGSKFKAPDTLTLEDVKLKLHFTDGMKPLVKDVACSKVSSEGACIVLEWKYDPAKVKELKSTQVVSAAEIKNQK